MTGEIYSRLRSMQNLADIDFGSLWIVNVVPLQTINWLPIIKTSSSITSIILSLIPILLDHMIHIMMKMVSPLLFVLMQITINRLPKYGLARFLHFTLDVAIQITLHHLDPPILPHLQGRVFLYLDSFLYRKLLVS
jgi:hypothetical protein